jgi:hypothetical protein
MNPNMDPNDTDDRREMARAVRAIPKPDPSLSTIEKVRWVVDNRQYNRVNGTFMDMMTASVIIQIYDALSETNKVKFAAMKVARMAEVAFKIADKCRA